LKTGSGIFDLQYILRNCFSHFDFRTLPFGNSHQIERNKVSQNHINIGIEALLEQIEDAVNELNEEGAKAFQQGDYNRARGFLRDAERVSDFRSKVKGLQKEWSDLFYRPRNLPAAAEKEPPNLTQHFRGLRTPEETFRRPLLESLQELGGFATLARLLETTGLKVKNTLNDYDRQPLPSSPAAPRWHNTVRWCLYTLSGEELARNDSSRGVWEILEKGRLALKNPLTSSPGGKEKLQTGNSIPPIPDLEEKEKTVKRFA